MDRAPDCGYTYLWFVSTGASESERMTISKEKIDQTINNTQSYLLRQRRAGGFWTGNLSSSAVSTATAVFALASVNRRTYQNLIEGGLYWLKDHQNEDGGWGDTPQSVSQLSTTLVCLSAFSVSDGSFVYNEAIAKAEAWVKQQVGSNDPKVIALAVDQLHGRDKSFSAPVLMMCAMGKRLGPKHTGWQYVKPLPFELAALPPQFFKSLPLTVVNYALPVLIAIGQARFHFKKPSSPVTRRLRKACVQKTLKVLKTLQPESGGFLESPPLTAFVVMSLAGTGLVDHRIVTQGAYFLVDSVRDDGSWPIHSHLATGATTLAVNALCAGTSDMTDALTSTRDWLLTQQRRQVHATTHAAPGAWASNELPGAVPDVENTAAALIAMFDLSSDTTRSQKAAAKGIRWLVEQQNKDGGMPMFCRDWTRLRLERSAPDITAHALGAMGCWWGSLPKRLKKQTTRAMQRAMVYLKTTQHRSGFWTPLWFGHEQTSDHRNPVYGTSRVVTHLAHVPQSFRACMHGEIKRATKWLLAVQHPKGSWGADVAICSSLEESAVAVDALAATLTSHDLLLFDDQTQAIQNAIHKGTVWLTKATAQGTTFDPSPIGLWFGRLWYSDDLYPVAFTLGALNKAKSALKRQVLSRETRANRIVELPAQNKQARASESADILAL